METFFARILSVVNTEKMVEVCALYLTTKDSSCCVKHLKVEYYLVFSLTNFHKIQLNTLQKNVEAFYSSLWEFLQETTF